MNLINLMIIVDDEDLPLLRSRAWEDSGTGYFKAKFSGKMLYLHRIIAGAKKGQIVDHIDHNLLNNRRSNLRLCDRSGSNMNRRKRSDRKLPYKGISKRGSKWVAQIMANKVYQWIGLFDTPEAAASAYNTAARRLHGEFAKLNDLEGRGSA